MSNPMRVLEFFAGTAPSREAIAEELAGHPVHYVAFGSTATPGPTGHADSFIELHHASRLNFQNAKALQRQLDLHLGKGGFDRIFAVMPYSEKTMHSDGSKVFRVVGRRLNPGGKLIHVFEEKSHLLGVHLLPRFGVPWSEDPQGDFKANRQALERLAKSGGLRLAVYGFQFIDVSKSGQLGIRWLTTEPNGLYSAENIGDFVRRHSLWADAARHVAVFMKPKK